MIRLRYKILYLLVLTCLLFCKQKSPISGNKKFDFREIMFANQWNSDTLMSLRNTEIDEITRVILDEPTLDTSLFYGNSMVRISKFSPLGQSFIFRIFLFDSYVVFTKKSTNDTFNVFDFYKNSNRRVNYNLISGSTDIKLWNEIKNTIQDMPIDTCNISYLDGIRWEIESWADHKYYFRVVCDDENNLNLKKLDKIIKNI